MIPLVALAPLLPLILQYWPDFARWVGGPKAEAITTKGAEIIRDVTGFTDPVRASIALADPQKEMELRVKLAEVAAQEAASERQAELEKFKAGLADVASARSQTVSLAQANSKIAWAAPIISIVIVSGFFIVPALSRWVDAQPDPIWLGALIAGFGAVYQYWLGGSASGRRAQEAVQAVAEQSANTSSRTIDAVVKAQNVPPPAIIVPPIALPSATATPVTADWQQAPYGGVRWQLTADGVLVEGDSVPRRTVGEPATARRIWRDFGAYIQQSCARNGVPVELVVACIATESRGVINATLKEPDGRQSVGLMQTLIGTAQEVMGRAVSYEELLTPEVSIEAGTRYLKRQYEKTKFQPPLAAAAYNAGGLYQARDQDNNRWNLRSTGDHIDRFVLYFNDAVYVSKTDNWSKAS